MLLLAFSPATWADQAFCVSDKEAEAARRVLQAQREIRHFCEPCGDTEPKTEVIATVRIVHDCGTEVHVNGEGIDLAYVYVLENGEWVNLALKLSIANVDGVSRVLAK
jgi:hypothetical protein